MYKPDSAIRHFGSAHIYSLSFSSLDNLHHLLHIPIQAMLSAFSTKLRHTDKSSHFSLVELPAMMIGERCYSAVAVVLTVCIKYSVWNSVLSTRTDANEFGFFGFWVPALNIILILETNSNEVVI